MKRPEVEMDLEVAQYIEHLESRLKTHMELLDEAIERLDWYRDSEWIQAKTVNLKVNEEAPKGNLKVNASEALIEEAKIRMFADQHVADRMRMIGMPMPDAAKDACRFDFAVGYRRGVRESGGD